MGVRKLGKYINGKWKESMLAVLKTENNLWSKLVSKVKIR